MGLLKITVVQIRETVFSVKNKLLLKQRQVSFFPFLLPRSFTQQHEATSKSQKTTKKDFQHKTNSNGWWRSWTKEFLFISQNRCRHLFFSVRVSAAKGRFFTRSASWTWNISWGRGPARWPGRAGSTSRRWRSRGPWSWSTRWCLSSLPRAASCKRSPAIERSR